MCDYGRYIFIQGAVDACVPLHFRFVPRFRPRARVQRNLPKTGKLTFILVITYCADFAPHLTTAMPLPTWQAGV
jgi:hypothetical protein